MTALDELLDDLFDDRDSALYSEFEGWLRDSRRFKAFAIRYRAKIRAKLRNVRDDSRLEDLREELRTAMLLLREEHFTLEYETYAALKQRGPDFTVTFKTHTPFNVEVRRIRSIEMSGADTEARVSKLMAVLCDKVGQMPPGIVNVLWLVAGQEVSHADLTRAMVMLRQLADRKVEDLFARCGFANAADFLKHDRQLSGIVVPQSGEHVLWLNPRARHIVPPAIVTAIRRLKFA